MALPADTPRSRTKSLVALWLTFAAGMVDIIGFLAVYHIFVAHMTGNTVHLGNDLVTADWSEAAKAASTIFSFVAGSVIGRAVIEAGARKRWRTVASFTLLFEALLVFAFIWVGTLTLPASSRNVPMATVCGLLALLAAAMGLQTATLTRIGPLTVHTTFVTGMLNKLAQAISEWLFWLHDRLRQNTAFSELWPATWRHFAFRNALFMSSIWISYLAGALAGTWMHSRWNLRAMYLPILILSLAAIADQFRPLSVEEEREQV